MATLEHYIIDLKALGEEPAHYEYLLDNDFFALLETTEVQKGALKAIVDVRKQAASFELNFQIDGEVVVLCDRCLDEMTQPITSTDKLTVKFGEDYSDEGDDVVIVPEDEGVVNVAWFIYEFIALAIPIRHVHAAGECNPEMERKLQQHLTDNEAEETAEKPADPRWEGLRNLLDNN